MNRWSWPLLILGLAAGLEAFAPSPGSGPASTIKSPHGKMDEECSVCHSAEAWKPARITERFDHARFGFSLDGAHRRTPCVSCHPTLDFSGAQARCETCHEDVHAGELGSDCGSCHTARSFIERSRMEREHRLTRFPLTGVHATLDCEVCHAGAEPGHLTFVNRDAACVSCHEAEYLAAQPDHRSVGFSESCEDCHGTGGWGSADFEHGGTGFPLTGAHAALDCQRCHGTGGFLGLSSACASCHQSDYDGTAAPNHTQLGFSTDCASCHGTSTWAGARFDHDGPFFPIFSGTHRGRWDACADCHVNPAAYSEFSCLGCHPHSDRAKTDGDHQGENGYSYDSQACYGCHPRGSKEGD